jgi:hypothetical protein
VFTRCVAILQTTWPRHEEPAGAKGQKHHLHCPDAAPAKRVELTAARRQNAAFHLRAISRERARTLECRAERDMRSTMMISISLALVRCKG